MKRHIIRSFFIGLLLLFVGGWVGSNLCGWATTYRSRNRWDAECLWGEIRLNWRDSSWLYSSDAEGWWFYACPIATYVPQVNVPSYDRYFGFCAYSHNNEMLLVIPFWFLTALSVTLLWLVCRWTRPKAKGRAFPVVMEKPKAETSDSLK